MRPPGSGFHFDPVWAARITGSRWGECAQNPPPVINAFLTLNAVTQW
jgi:hypothetical protein